MTATVPDTLDRGDRAALAIRGTGKDEDSSALPGAGRMILAR